jgi:hypothetical protein
MAGLDGYLAGLVDSGIGVDLCRPAAARPIAAPGGRFRIHTPWCRALRLVGRLRSGRSINESGRAVL